MKEQIIDLIFAIGNMIDRDYRDLNSAEIAFACEAVAQAQRELLFKTVRERHAEITSPSIDVLHLSTRAANGLAEWGISTIAQLEKTSERELLRIPNFGRKCLRDVQDALVRYRAPNGAAP